MKYLLVLIVIFSGACKNEMIITHAIRLKPGEDLKKSIQAYANENKIKAGWISTCAGSLTNYNIRFANQPAGNTGDGHFEIVSLSGTVSINGSHIHMSIADTAGKVFGGHLLDNNLVYTTAEIIILEDKSLQFKREKDGTTEWEELQISSSDE